MYAMSEQKKFVDLDLADVDGTNSGSLRKYVGLLVLLFILLLLIMGMFVAARAITFEPLTVYSYYTEYLEYCPFEPVNVMQEIEIQDKWYYRLTTIEGENFMLYNTVQPYGGTPFEVPIMELPRDVYPSNTLRLAPPVPGEWSAGGKGVINGYMFGFIPVKQTIEPQSTPPYQVKAWDDPDCLGKVLPDLDYPKDEGKE